MEFQLSGLSIVNGARFVDSKNDNDEPVKRLIITVHITTKVVQCPYDGKFQQVDYDVDLDLPDNNTPSEISDMLPVIAQNWINNKYPST